MNIRRITLTIRADQALSDQLQIPAQTRQIQRYGFLLVPDFSLIGFSSAVEALHMANRLVAHTIYEVVLIGAESGAVQSSCGVEIKTECGYEDAGQLDALILCGPASAQRVEFADLITRLKRLQRSTRLLGGIGTGAYLLACAGLLDGYRATTHWLDLPDFRQEFPLIDATGTLFEIDRDRLTCSGGTAAMDMLLFLIGREHGIELASAISEQFVCERIRASDDPQRVPLKVRLGTQQPNLTEAVMLMEANIEEPLSIDDLASLIGVSRRHLERLFKQHLQAMPSQYYLELRLEKARQQLRNASHPILQVGLMCGFSSASYFSTSYRNHFGITPRQERRQAQLAEGLLDLQTSFGRSSPQ